MGSLNWQSMSQVTVTFTDSNGNVISTDQSGLWSSPKKGKKPVKNEYCSLCGRIRPENHECGD